MRQPLRPLTLPLLLSLAGCPADPCDRAAETEATLILGVGEDEFRPIEDGETLELDYGNQGGRHVWTALRATGINPGETGLLTADRDAPLVDLALTGETSGSEMGSYQSDWVAFTGTPEESELTGIQLVIYLGYTSYYDTTTEEEAESYVLSGTVTDSCGTTVKAQATVALPD